MTGKTQTKKPTPNRLYRSEKNKILGGVSSGLGEFFNIDQTIMRIAFILLSVFGGSGIILYLILWAIIPSESNLNIDSAEAIKENLAEMKLKAKSTAEQFRGDSKNNNRSLLSIVLVILGVVFLLDNFNIFRFNFGELWPILLIVLGIVILRKR